MKSEEKKKIFCIVTGFIIVLSFVLSFFWIELAEYAAIFVENCNSHLNDKFYDHSNYRINIEKNTEIFRENPANAFVYVFGTIILLLIIIAARARQLLGVTVILLIIYIMSAFYSIMGFILTPISNLVTIAIFAPLIIFYHRRIINGIALISAIISIIGIAYYTGKRSRSGNGQIIKLQSRRSFRSYRNMDFYQTANCANF